MDEKLEYFKKKILAHLDDLEQKENAEKKELKKSLLAFEMTSIEKAGYPVGTIREWKGKKYIKVAPGKWKPKYDSHSRGAKMAIAALKKKIDACTDSEELMQIILENRDRFSDENGRPLPFVKELSDYISGRNDTIESEKNETPKKGGENTADFGVKVGDKVSFESKGKMLEGIVRGGDKDSIIIDGIGEGKGIRYTVPGNQVKEKTGNADGTIPAKVFSAADYKKQFTDPLATNDENGIKHILDSFGAEGREIAEKAAETEKRVKESKQTIDQYRLEGEGVFAKYMPERERLHNQIIASFFEPDKIHSARPPKGEKPTFVMFGGRGGSGKSWFTDKERAKAAGVDVMFDSDKYIIIDADAIKEKLKPPYEGWNAGVVHEESSDISKMVIDMAKKLGLNIILDGTMSNPKKAVKQMQDFKNLGYRTEAHYMFLPVQESTKRAIGRFKTKNNDYSGRFVPLKNLVGMTDNELAFDEVKNIVDDWSFRSNYNVERGKPPVLVSKKE